MISLVLRFGPQSNIYSLRSLNWEVPFTSIPSFVIPITSNNFLRLVVHLCVLASPTPSTEAKAPWEQSPHLPHSPISIVLTQFLKNRNCSIKSGFVDKYSMGAFNYTLVVMHKSAPWFPMPSPKTHDIVLIVFRTLLSQLLLKLEIKVRPAWWLSPFS